MHLLAIAKAIGGQEDADMNATLSQTTPLLAERRVLHLSEAAMIAGVSPSTLKRRGQAGDLKITRLSPRRIGVRVDHLREWLDASAA